MPSELMRLEADDGSEVLIEIDAPPEGWGDVAFDGTTRRAKETFEQSLTGVRAMALKALDAFRGGATAPDQVELEFGVKFKAEASAAVFAKTAGEGHIVVRLSWAGKPGGATEPDDE